MSELDRRTFLALGGLAFAGLATACSNGGGTDVDESSLDGLIKQAEESGAQKIQVFQASGPILAGLDARVTFALANAEGTARITGGVPRVWYASQGGSPRGPVEARFHGEGLGDKGIYVTRLDLEQTGVWRVLVTAEPPGTKLYGEAAYQAVDRVSGPAPGSEAIAVPTPTVENHRGVEPYCTRRNESGEREPCSMHAISLDVALANGKPTVFNIGTPEFCSSRVCGPVVDVIQTVAAELRDRVNFVHAEVFPDATDAPARHQLAPAPAAWGLTDEPITYWIRPDTTITERIVGPVDVAETRELTRSLLS